MVARRILVPPVGVRIPPRQLKLLSFRSFFIIYQMENLKYTPENITSLEPDEIFVFGSNLQGYHAGGAARTAVRLFGAKMGQGVGIQGQSYAIPTMQGGVETIKPYVDDFIELASEWDQTTF